jgi:hypothetical protein
MTKYLWEINLKEVFTFVFLFQSFQTMVADSVISEPVVRQSIKAERASEELLTL